VAEEVLAVKADVLTLSLEVRGVTQVVQVLQELQEMQAVVPGAAQELDQLMLVV
jgi:hypothetical protein